MKPLREDRPISSAGFQLESSHPYTLVVAAKSTAAEAGGDVVSSSAGGDEDDAQEAAAGDAVQPHVPVMMSEVLQCFEGRTLQVYMVGRWCKAD